MREIGQVYLQGEIVEERVEFTLVELSHVAGASAEEIVLWVEEGAFEPRGRSVDEWRFSGGALQRAVKARRLSHDLELNPQGVALALELLDEIEALRARLGYARERDE
jgi:chaperone modulatory protein CbpM